MGRTIALCFEYDGTAFVGSQWQRTGRSVQGELEAAWQRLTNETGRWVFAGRTDRGVHALAQVAHIHSETTLELSTIVKALNALTERDMSIHQAWEMPAEFHARFSARQRAYRYVLDVHPTPAATLQQRAVHLPEQLDRQAMQEALHYLRGEHDFAAFAGGAQTGSTVRVCTAAHLEQQTILGLDLIAIVLIANAFLRHMVRNVVGTLILVGQGRISPQHIQTLLAGRDRRLVGPTAPPHGLYLEWISYDPAFAPLQMSERWDHQTYWRTVQGAP